ncbi:hypothetical protein HY488_03425 [Candidatus Woesearchaeota archaeon]|nr:hypothetical protein [Candidatus Woesearchaeota archaeon]
MSWFHKGMLQEFEKIARETEELHKLVVQYQQQGLRRERHISREEFNRRILALCEKIIQHMKSGEAMAGKAVLSLSKVHDLTLDEVKQHTSYLNRLLLDTIDEDTRKLIFSLVALQGQLVAWEKEFLRVVELAKQNHYDINDPALSQPFHYESSPSVIVTTLRNIQALAKKLGIDLEDVLPRHPQHYFTAKVDHYERKLRGLLGMAA